MGQSGYDRLVSTSIPARGLDSREVPQLQRLHSGVEVPIERWFAAQGRPPALDLARSGAPRLTTADLLELDPLSVHEYLRLPLDYGAGEGEQRLREAVVAAGGARSAAEVVITHGAAEALLLACAITLAPGDHALVATPAYGGLSAAPAAVGALVREIPVWRSGDALVDVDGLHERLDDRPAAVLVNRPHNPTGGVLDAANLELLARAAAHRGSHLIVDEVARGTLAGALPSASASPAFGAGHLIVCGDLSKALGLGGLRIGWLTCADRGVLRRAAALKDLTSLGNAAPSQLLGAIALENHHALLGRVRAVAGHNLGLLAATVVELGGELPWPRDGLVAFPALPLGLPSIEFAHRLRDEAGVAVVPGALFGHEGRLRIGIGAPREEFAAGLAALAAACSRTGSRPEAGEAAV
ncbi:MAG: pyridoxal phosphate-dependent aminotransferase [Candidatus Dormibacteria bacterium]